MSSLRPLATITLLAAVGVFLYMKINETDPVLPPGVGEWTIESPEVGGGATVAAAPGAAPSALPAAAGDDAPAFEPSASPATTSAAAPSDVAAPWTPGPAATAPPSALPPSADESSPTARTAANPLATPPMPPLPAMNPVDSAPTSSTESVAGQSASSAPSQDAAIAAAAGAAAGAAALGAAPGADEPAAPADVTTPLDSTTPTAASLAPGQSSMFAAARVAVQGALDRGELAQALLLLSDWYDDPSLTPDETAEVEQLLSQLAGSVIYEGPPAHRLVPAYIVQAGETLEDIARKYDVPWQLLAKINGVSNPAALEPGQELKVMRGPFSALVDLSERTMTLMLDRRYAGQFAIEIDPDTSIEEGQWKVDQKQLTPSGGGAYGQQAVASEDRSLLLANPSGSGQVAVVRGPGSSDPLSGEPAGRVIRLKDADVNDVYDILSEGSRVTIRR